MADHHRRNRATDRLRREAVGAAKLRQAALLSVPDEPGDDQAAVVDVNIPVWKTACGAKKVVCSLG